MSRHNYLRLEFVLLFFCGPLLVLFGVLPNWPIPVLLTTCSIALFVLYRDKEFDRDILWKSEQLGAHLLSIAKYFLVIGPLIAAFTWIFFPAKLFALILRAPVVWAIVMVAYPVLSVYPQELLYRCFLFHRYRNIFLNEMGLLFASAVSFGFVHLVFGNWIAVGFSALGGLLFAWRYQQTRSLLVVSIEHAIYGQLIFSIGLGHFFYAGSVSIVSSSMQILN